MFNQRLRPNRGDQLLQDSAAAKPKSLLLAAGQAVDVAAETENVQ